MKSHAQPKPIGGAIFDRPMIVLLSIFGIAAAVIVYRFIAGIGAVSNMNDGYTWGIWEPVNVVVFTGIGAGAYSVGLLCYLLNKGQYHPLVRPAVLLGAISYTLGGASIVVAVGRPWNIYWLALPGMWNLSSVLLEVAVCVIAYVTVLWIEVLPAVLEGAAASASPARAALARKWHGRVSRAMPYVIALAMVLPTMHQSSLGGLMLIAGTKLHGLWHTPLLPLLALISCLSMGLGAVVMLTAVMKHTWNAKSDQTLFVDISRVNAGLLVLFALVRFIDIAARGKLPLLAVADRHLLIFVVEMALFLVPAFLFFTRGVHNSRVRVVGATMVVLAGAMWRVDCFLTCYKPGDAWSYYPSLGELAVTVGMMAIGAAVFITISKLFPVVVVDEAGRPSDEAGSTSVPASIAAFVLAFPRGKAARQAPSPSSAEALPEQPELAGAPVPVVTQRDRPRP